MLTTVFPTPAPADRAPDQHHPEGPRPPCPPVHGHPDDHLNKGPRERLWKRSVLTRKHHQGLFWVKGEGTPVQHRAEPALPAVRARGPCPALRDPGGKLVQTQSREGDSMDLCGTVRTLPYRHESPVLQKGSFTES